MRTIEVSKELGAAIRTARKEQGKTQQEMAAQMGTTAGYLSRVERGGENVSRPVFMAMLGELGVDGRLAVDIFEGLLPQDVQLVTRPHATTEIVEKNGVRWPVATVQVLPKGCRVVKGGVRLPDKSVRAIASNPHGLTGELPEGTAIDNGTLLAPGQTAPATPRDRLWVVVSELPPEKYLTAVRLLEALLANGTEQKASDYVPRIVRKKP